MKTKTLIDLGTDMIKSIMDLYNMGLISKEGAKELLGINDNIEVNGKRYISDEKKTEDK